MADGQTINIPQLLVVILLSGLAIRYFFFAPASPNGGGAPGGARGNGNLRAREADVERIQQMFPQVSRRQIIWDLQRNGGNVVATTERILSGRLEVPPISFQPPVPEPSSATSTQVTPAASTKPLQPDLIKRYNLQSKIAQEEAEQAAAAAAAAEAKSQKQGWSQNKDERQALLRRRREEMILAARRKMAAKLAADGEESSAATA